MPIRAVGVAPFWKGSVVLCIMDSRVSARDDFKVCGEAGLSGVLFRTRSAHLSGVVDGKSSVVVDPRLRPPREGVRWENKVVGRCELEGKEQGGKWQPSRETSSERRVEGWSE